MIFSKRILVSILFLTSLFSLHAQTKTPEAEDSPKEHLPQSESIDLEPHIDGDMGQIFLKDNQTTAQIDSLWVAELTNSDLYPKMQQIILKTPYADSEISPADYQELSIDTLKMRLAALNAKTPFDIKYTPDLAQMIKIYLHRNKKGMERLMSLSLYYFPLFEKVLDKYNLPLELKYLPIVESALNPQAKSYVGATGLWQFMFATGKMMGLSVSSYVDERMNPVQSTEAAAQYLTRLYKIFGDWNLALASYNAGPGNVTKAIRRSGGQMDYWKLRPYLPKQTANYVPAFYAVMYLFNYAEEYGYEPYVPKEIYFTTDTVRIKQTVTFEQIAEATGVTEDLIAFLNPSYKLHIVPHIAEENFGIRLPIQAVGLFVANEEVIYHYSQKELAKRTLPQYYKVSDKIHYRVRPGDYLGKIAGRFGVSVRDIKRWNRIRGSMIRVGQRLIIYPDEPVAVRATQNSQSKPSSSNPKVYVVQKGDTLWDIARKFNNISVREIKEWNDIRGNTLKPGMRLKVSQS